MCKLKPRDSKLSLRCWRDKCPVDSAITMLGVKMQAVEQCSTETGATGPHAAMDKIRQVGTADVVQRVPTVDGVQQGLEGEGDTGLRWRWRL